MTAGFLLVLTAGMGVLNVTAVLGKYEGSTT